MTLWEVNVEDLLIETLSSLNYPVFRQGSLTEDEPYPDDFFTFWNISSSDDDFYDNKETRTIWEYRICFYSNNPQHTYDVLREAILELKQCGFIIDGKGYDVASDEITHTGRGVSALYIETSNS